MYVHLKYKSKKIANIAIFYTFFSFKMLKKAKYFNIF